MNKNNNNECALGRGRCLTAYLIIVIIAGLVVIPLMIFYKHPESAWYYTSINWFRPITIVLSLLLLISCFAMWLMKKWGVYLFAGIFILGNIINLVVGMPLDKLVSQIFGILIFLFVIWRPFNRMT
jgi:hypothetical protein